MIFLSFLNWFRYSTIYTLEFTFRQCINNFVKIELRSVQIESMNAEMSKWNAEYSTNWSKNVLKRAFNKKKKHVDKTLQLGSPVMESFGRKYNCNLSQSTTKGATSCKSFVAVLIKTKIDFSKIGAKQCMIMTCKAYKNDAPKLGKEHGNNDRAKLIAK